MSADRFPYAFRILGPLDGPRKRVDAAAAHDAYRRCDPRAQVDREAYLSHFWFDETFREHLAATGSTRGFMGATWAEELVFDIDDENDLGSALEAVRRLHETLIRKYEVPPDGINIHFSGNKGFHLTLPPRLWLANGGPHFNRVAGAFAARIAAEAEVKIDMSVYDRVRALRAANSRHPKTGLHKRHIPRDALGGVAVKDVLELARQPAAFGLPNCNGMPIVDGLVVEWEAARSLVAAQEAVAKERRTALAEGLVRPTLNRLTMEIIRGEPVDVGDRHRLIYSAARDLAESGAPRHLIDSLLRDAALDTGLPPREVDRQLDCGFNDAVKTPSPAISNEPDIADGSGRNEAGGVP